MTNSDQHAIGDAFDPTCGAGGCLARAVDHEAAYAVLAVALFAVLLSESLVQTVDGSWTGDFWEHAAVVRELARHLLRPADPILAVDEPHAFFSPYALVLGAVARVTGLSATTVLGLVGLVNLAALLAALPRFVRLFAAEPLAPFGVLVFTLFLWGRHPLVFSGFFHADVIGLVLPYPSTFATALTLWAVAAWVEGRGRLGPRRVAFVAVAAAVVLLTHPVAALFLVVLLAAFSVGRLERRNVVALAAVAATMLAAAALWPYYPFFRLLREQEVFDLSNEPLYRSMLVQVFPALLGVPAAIVRLRRNRLDPLVLSLAVLAVVYAVGGATSHWSLGRVLPYGVLLLDVALASWLASRLTRGTVVALAAALVLVAIPLMSLTGPAARTLPRGIAPGTIDRYRPESVGAEYSRLFAGVPRDSVTMAPEPAGWVVPAFGGRIVSPLHPQAFVPDLGERARDVATFFAAGTGTRTRRALLCRYRASYVLVDRRVTEGTYGRTRAAAGPYVLFEDAPCA